MAHELKKAQYEADALWHPRPWKLWEYEDCGIYGTPTGEPSWHPRVTYRRKPDAPNRNCGICKFIRCDTYPCGTSFSCTFNGSNSVLNMDERVPSWCPLDQPETIDTLFEALGNDDEQSIEEVKADLEEQGIEVNASMAGLKSHVEKWRNESDVKMIAGALLVNKAFKAAEDLLLWAESFDLLRGVEKVKAMRKALNGLEGK